MSADQASQDGRKGKLTVIGIGPGGEKQITLAAIDALSQADAVIGYGIYLRQIESFVDQSRLQEFPMGKEQERALEAVRLAVEGLKVALVTGGDPGIYDMASPVLELLAEMEPDDRLMLDVEIVPGVTSASLAASMIGSPLAQDHAAISLSDRFVPWEQIERRLDAVAGANMVIALYEPSSKHRPGQLGKAQEVILRHREPDTVAAVVREAGNPDETITITTLDKITDAAHDKRTVVIVGNSKTKTVGDWMITPRAW